MDAGKTEMLRDMASVCVLVLCTAGTGVVSISKRLCSNTVAYVC